MAVRVADTIKPMGAGGYPIAMAEDIQVSSTDKRTVKKALEDLGGSNATTTTAGVVKINDDGLDIASDGTLSLDVATDTTIGGVIVGDNLKVDSSGKIEIDTDTIYTKNDVYSKAETKKEINASIGSLAATTTGDLANGNPVGCIISHVGTGVPEGFLRCDGATYNIADYPELADFILQNFGAYDYYGGDGVTTFGTPVIPAKIDTYRVNSYMTSNSSNGEVASASSNYSGYPAYFAFDSNTENYWCSSGGGGTQWLKLNLGKPKAFNNITMNFYKAVGLTVQISNDDITYTTIDTASGINSYNKDYSSTHTAQYIKFITTCGDYHGVYNCAINNKIRQYYFIKYSASYYLDINSENSFVSEYYDNYSEDEIVIGKWIDGKPLYRRVFHLNSPSTINSSTVLFIYDSTLEVRELSGCILCPDENIPVNFYYATNNYVSCWSNHTHKQLTMVVGNSTYINRPLDLIVLYTKTTDAPNSFTPQMIYDNFTLGELDETCVEDDVKEVLGL